MKKQDRSAQDKVLELVDNALGQADWLSNQCSEAAPREIPATSKTLIRDLIGMVNPNTKPADYLIFFMVVDGAFDEMHQSIETRDFSRTKARITALLNSARNFRSAWDSLRTELAVEATGNSVLGALYSSEGAANADPFDKIRFNKEIESDYIFDRVIENDFDRLIASLVSSIELIESTSLHISAFKYRFLVTLAIEWNRVTRRPPSMTRNMERSLTPFQRCVAIILSESDARSRALRNSIDYFTARFANPIPGDEAVVRAVFEVFSSDYDAGIQFGVDVSEEKSQK